LNRHRKPRLSRRTKSCHRYRGRRCRCGSKGASRSSAGDVTMLANLRCARSLNC
jgi:hypothetical protein